MIKIFTREELNNYLSGLSKDFEVIGPKELPNKGIFYQPITETQDLYLGDGFTIEPVKKFFLSPSEYFFREKFSQGGESLEEVPLSANKRMVIGVRPCEARGLTLLDKVFDSDYKDNFYIANRKRTIIVGMACSEPDNNCFCTSLGGSPAESRGMDAIIFPGAGGFIMEIITKRAMDIFVPLGKGLEKEEEKAWAADKEKMKGLLTKKVNLSNNMDSLFESPYWGKVSMSCLSCGICTYLCPTCHCFDLVDEKRKRLRCYDGCAFHDFTLEASGENPRRAKEKRYRQRVFHKFDYFKKNFGENLCVGCGRCIRHCPVKMDIAEIVNNIPVTSNQ